MTNKAQPHILFRADASILIGAGHVMRCLTLADAFHERGARCTFICRPHRGHLIDEIIHRGHQVKALPELTKGINSLISDSSHTNWLGTDWLTDAQDTREIIGNQTFDWLVVDHYALDQKWEMHLRSCCKHLMVIDDLADRPHECDILLDQNLGRSAKDYLDLLNNNSITFIGPNYALLRPEFAQFRKESLARRSPSKLKNLMISLGGVDKDNATSQVLQALNFCNLSSNFCITVVMGTQAPYLAEVKAQSKLMKWPTTVLVGVRNMAQLMVDSDLCIGAAGSTSWERCCLGLPCLLLVLACNQRTSATALANAQAARVLDIADIFNSLPTQMNELTLSDNLSKLTEYSKSITNGRGAQLIVDQIMASLNKKESATRFNAVEAHQ